MRPDIADSPRPPESGIDRPPSLAVCVATYLRPEGLLRLLSALARSEFEDPVPAVEVVVIDNDATGAARAVCEQVRDWFPFEIHYAIEKRRGIPQARNAALTVAIPRADFVVMTDDDVEPTPNWLTELLRVAREYDADVVAGPNPPKFLDDPPAWIVEGGFFDGSSHATGTRIEAAATHNVMVRSAALESLDHWFDESLGLQGWDDTELFLRLGRAGHRMVWAEEAIVNECIPASRTTLRWLLQRAYRIANGMGSAQSRALRGPTRIGVVVEMLRCFARGTGALLSPRNRGPAARAHALWLIVSGVGWLTGLLGVRYREYRSVHGS